jgi:hypothetical protein
MWTLPWRGAATENAFFAWMHRLNLLRDRDDLGSHGDSNGMSLAGQRQ